MPKYMKQKYTVIVVIVIVSALLTWILTQDTKLAIVVPIASVAIALFAIRMAGTDDTQT